MPDHESVKTFRFKELQGHVRKPDTSIISDGILRKGSMLIVGGPPKAYKSFILNTMATSLATGRNLFGATRIDHGRPHAAFTIDKPRRVLIIEQEIGEDDLEDRLVPIYQSLSPVERERLDENLFTHSFDPTLCFDKQQGMLALEQLLCRVQADVVIFDPLIEFHSQEENSNTAMGGMLKNLMRLCRKCDVTPIISHHEGREGPVARDGADRLRGATALFGKGDTFLSLRVTNRRAARIQIDFTLRRAKPLRSIMVKIDPISLEAKFLCWHGSKEWKKHSKPVDDSDLLDDFDGQIQ